MTETLKFVQSPSYRNERFHYTCLFLFLAAMSGIAAVDSSYWMLLAYGSNCPRLVCGKKPRWSGFIAIAVDQSSVVVADVGCVGTGGIVIS